MLCQKLCFLSSQECLCILFTCRRMHDLKAYQLIHQWFDHLARLDIVEGADLFAVKDWTHCVDLVQGKSGNDVIQHKLLRANLIQKWLVNHWPSLLTLEPLTVSQSAPNQLRASPPGSRLSQEPAQGQSSLSLCIEYTLRTGRGQLSDEVIVDGHILAGVQYKLLHFVRSLQWVVEDVLNYRLGSLFLTLRYLVFIER